MALVLTQNEPASKSGASGDGPVRFYIVDGAGIRVSQYVIDSPFSIVGVNWMQALPELVRRYPGRAESLEINCHGLPGTLFVDPAIDPTLLPTFASAVRGLLRPYGTVEFLACFVANYDVRWLIDYWKSSPERKADVEFLNSWLKNDNEGGGSVDRANTAAFQRLWDEGFEAAKAKNFHCPYPEGSALAFSWNAGAEAAKGSSSGSRPGSRGLVMTPQPFEAQRKNTDHARLARLAIETGLPQFGSSNNGPLFCSRAARLLRCTVRAGMSAQYNMASGMSLDEFLRTKNYQIDNTDGWVGHVFDFAPGGGVSYVGFNVTRPVFVPITPGGDGPLRNT